MDVNQTQQELLCIYKFADAIASDMAHQEAWLSGMALLLSDKSSAAFTSWCVFHINDIDLMYKKLETRGKVWPGITSAVAWLHSSSYIITRAHTYS